LDKEGTKGRESGNHGLKMDGSDNGRSISQTDGKEAITSQAATSLAPRMGKTKRVANGDNVPRVVWPGLKGLEASKVCLPLGRSDAGGISIGKPREAIGADGIFSGLGGHDGILWKKEVSRSRARV
jgi:hypothetical protein